MAAQTVTAKSGSVREAIQTGRMNRRAWIVTILLVIFQIINFADKAVIGLVAPQAIPDLGISAAQFGFIGSAFFFLFSASSVVVGALAGRVSTKWIIFAMSLSWAVLQFPILLGGGAAVLLVSRILLGAAEGPATPMSLQATHAWFSAKNRALPSSLIAIGSTLGPIVAAPILVVIIREWGWRWAFGTLGIVGLVFTLAWLLLGADGPFSAHSTKKHTLLRSAPRMHPERADSGTGAANGADSSEEAAHPSDLLKPVPFRAVLLSSTFILAVFAGFTNFWTLGFLTTWAPTYLTGVVGLSPMTMGFVSTFPWILGGIVLLGLGLVGRRLMRRGRSVRIAMAMPIGVCLIIAGAGFFILPSTSGAFAAAVLTVAAGCSVIYPMIPTAMAYAVGLKQRPLLMGTLGGVASLGGVISPTVVGMLMEAFGYVAESPGGGPATAEMTANLAGGIHASFILAGFLLVLAGLLTVIFVRPDRLAERLQQKFETVAPRSE